MMTLYLLQNKVVPEVWKTCMNEKKSKYHITTTVSELWNSDLKNIKNNGNEKRISCQITADQVDPNSKKLICGKWKLVHQCL